MEWLTLILATTVVTVAYAFWKTYASRRLHPLSAIPGPPLAAVTDWYISYFALKGNLHYQINKWHNEYGPVVRIGPEFVVFNQPSSYHDLYAGPSKLLKSERYAAVSASHDPNTISAIEKETVNTKRQPHLATWNGSMMQRSEDRVVGVISTFLSNLAQPPANPDAGERPDALWSASHDLGEKCTHLATDIAMGLTFGEDPALLKSETHRWIPSVMDFAGQRAVACAMQPWIYKLKLDRIMLAVARKGILTLGKWATDRTVERRRQGTNEVSRDLFDSMMASHRVKKDREFRGKDMWLEAFVMLGVGTTTTGPTMSSIFFYMLHNPQVLEKATAEIRSTFSSLDDIRMGDTLKGCSYLRACIDETLRMVPPVALPLPRRIPAEGTFIGGTFMPGGIDVASTLYALHRNGECFPDPNSFKPERWLDTETESYKKAKEAFKPFSEGPRICVGRGLAEMELNLTVARTLYTYDMRLAPGPEGCCASAKSGRCSDRTYASYAGASVSGPSVQVRKVI